MFGIHCNESGCFCDVVFHLGSHSVMKFLVYSFSEDTFIPGPQAGVQTHSRSQGRSWGALSCLECPRDGRARFRSPLLNLWRASSHQYSGPCTELTVPVRQAKRSGRLVSSLLGLNPHPDRQEQLFLCQVRTAWKT